MNEQDYRDGVIRTWGVDLTRMTPEHFELCMAAMGLAGEAGEICDYMKKVIFHGIPFDRAKIMKEMGDLRYYYTMLAVILDMTDDEIKLVNNQKLAERYPNGFVLGGGHRE